MKKVLVRKIYYSQEQGVSESNNYGVIGDSVEGLDYKIGDIVLVKSRSTTEVALVIKPPYSKNNNGALMGWAAVDINNQKEYEILQVVVPASELTEVILNQVHKGSFRIQEIKELTLDEVRDYVPFEFELVADKQIEKKQIYKVTNGEHYGIIGEEIEGTEFKVGDMVLWQNNSEDHKEHIGVNVVVKPRGSKGYLMGWASGAIASNSNYKTHKVIVPAELINEGILRTHYKDTFDRDIFNIRELQTLTLDELRKYVPFEFELSDQN